MLGENLRKQDEGKTTCLHKVQALSDLSRPLEHDKVVLTLNCHVD